MSPDEEGEATISQQGRQTTEEDSSQYKSAAHTSTPLLRKHFPSFWGSIVWEHFFILFGMVFLIVVLLGLVVLSAMHWLLPTVAENVGNFITVLGIVATLAALFLKGTHRLHVQYVKEKHGWVAIASAFTASFIVFFLLTPTHS